MPARKAQCGLAEAAGERRFRRERPARRAGPTLSRFCWKRLLELREDSPGLVSLRSRKFQVQRPLERDLAVAGRPEAVLSHAGQEGPMRPRRGGRGAAGLARGGPSASGPYLIEVLLETIT